MSFLRKKWALFGLSTALAIAVIGCVLAWQPKRQCYANDLVFSCVILGSYVPALEKMGYKLKQDNGKDWAQVARTVGVGTNGKPALSIRYSLQMVNGSAMQTKDMVDENQSALLDLQSQFSRAASTSACLKAQEFSLFSEDDKRGFILAGGEVIFDFEIVTDQVLGKLEQSIGYSSASEMFPSQQLGHVVINSCEDL